MTFCKVSQAIRRGSGGHKVSQSTYHVSDLSTAGIPCSDHYYNRK